MTGKIALCADAESLRHPEMIGLDDASLDDFAWLLTFSNAAEARISLSAAKDVEEVWVASCDGMDAINLAAGIRQDDPDKRVFLVSSASTGSILSKSRAAGLAGTLSAEGFARRFSNERRARELVAMPDTLHALGPAPAPAHEPGFESSLGVSSVPEALPAKAGRAAIVDDIDESDFSDAVKTSSVVLSVVSAGGGVGRSAFSVIAATLMARRGLKTVLVDGDLIGGDSAGLSGCKSQACFDDAVALGFEDWCQSCLTVCASGFAVVPAPERIEIGASLRPQLPAALTRLSAMFDVVIVNADANWDEHKLSLLEASTHVACLLGQRMSSVRLGQKALSLCVRCGVAETALAFALNRSGRDALFTSMDLSCALQGRRVFELVEGGRAVEELLGVGMPDLLVDEGNPFCKSVELMLDDMMPELAKSSIREGLGASGSKRRLFFGRKLQVGGRKSDLAKGGAK